MSGSSKESSPEPLQEDLDSVELAKIAVSVRRIQTVATTIHGHNPEDPLIAREAGRLRKIASSLLDICQNNGLEEVPETPKAPHGSKEIKFP